MSNKIQAAQLQICVFVLKDTDYDAQPDEAKKIFDSFASVVMKLQQMHNGNAPIELDFCPMAYDENVAIVTREGLDLSRLPAVQVNALYPDGSRRRYFLKSGLGGIDFTPETVAPYVTTLLYNRTSSPKPIICELFPPLCSVGAWFWLAATIYAGYKATQARNVGKVAWGGAALLSGQAFVAGGGIEELKKLGRPR